MQRNLRKQSDNAEKPYEMKYRLQGSREFRYDEEISIEKIQEDSSRISAARNRRQRPSITNLTKKDMLTLVLWSTSVRTVLAITTMKRG